MATFTGKLENMKNLAKAYERWSGESLPHQAGFLRNQVRAYAEFAQELRNWIDVLERQSLAWDINSTEEDFDHADDIPSMEDIKREFIYTYDLEDWQLDSPKSIRKRIHTDHKVDNQPNKVRKMQPKHTPTERVPSTRIEPLPWVLYNVDVTYHDRNRNLVTETVREIKLFESDYDKRDSVYLVNVKNVSQTIRIKTRFGYNYFSEDDIRTLLAGDEVKILVNKEEGMEEAWVFFDPQDRYDKGNPNYTGKFKFHGDDLKVETNFNKPQRNYSSEAEIERRIQEEIAKLEANRVQSQFDDEIDKLMRGYE